MVSVLHCTSCLSFTGGSHHRGSSIGLCPVILSGRPHPCLLPCEDAGGSPADLCGIRGTDTATEVLGEGYGSDNTRLYYNYV